ncbi:hypothetical protein QE372_000700 [Agrobacterium pusense]|uniref:hypothetical protein n=1 Tax=Agrobacterium pusense TaxID=648995 RepID=UPI00285911CB|nr:hypothetical protein [Agrobacterium pusense]MDR6188432.1 hypothetical protein [Agrobacterium pusense]
MRIIDLNSNGAERFDNPNKVLQDGAFAQLDTIIQAQILRLGNPQYTPPSGGELSYSRPHNGILIEGGRGSGKTTFLLNALHNLRGQSEASSQSWFKGLPSKLQVLPPIDPTLIETKEHIIIVIIALIDAALDDSASNLKGDLTTVNEMRRKMAEGLGLLDGIGKAEPFGDEWEDPEWIMSRGLRKARNGRSFEIKFQKYIFEALKVLDKKAFVLAFDDVDTNFQHGRTILETIRKYLTSPQLVLMISGDLELYGRLVRRNIYDTFGAEVMEYDPVVMKADTTGISAAVRELEEQYLLKIAPPQNRVAMLPLGGIMQADSATKVMVIPYEDTEAVPLQEWASMNIRRQLLEYLPAEGESSPPHPFFELVSREHLRLVIGYLRAIGDRDPSQGHRGVFSVFETRLRLAGVNSLQLAHATHNDALLLTFRWLVSQDKPTTLARFGVSSDADKAIILHCFALAISQGLKDSPAACLRTLFTLNLPISMMQRTSYSQVAVRKAILEFIWDEASPDLLDVAGRIGSIARYDTLEERSNSIGNLRASCFGSVGTKKKENRAELMRRMFDVPLAKVSDGVKSVRELLSAMKPKDTTLPASSWVRTLVDDTEVAEMNPQKGVVWFSLDDLTGRCGSFRALLDLLTYDRFSGRGEQFRSISALSMLAAIAKILADEGGRSLHELAQTSSIPAFLPDADVARTGQEDTEDAAYDEDGEADPLEANEQSDFQAFMERMANWQKFARHYVSGAETTDRKNVAVAPSQLARIAERIHDQLLSLDDEVTSTWKTGHILHRQITNILHALIVTTSGSTGRLASPKSSDRPLVEALRSATDNDALALHPLAAIVLACPLVWAFLNPDESYSASGSKSEILRDEVDKALQAFQEKWGSEQAPFESIWLHPPEISIAIGRSAAAPRIIKQNGFFDVLNVVPRYYPKANSAK